MNAHTEEEEKVDDAMLLGEDNPHAYLFGGDPIEPAAPEPYREPPVISQPVPPAPLPTIQPTSPKQVVAPPISSVSGSVPEPRRTVRPGEFDERFKATVEYVFGRVWSMNKPANSHFECWRAQRAKNSILQRLCCSIGTKTDEIV